jgi:hypothetical protein
MKDKPQAWRVGFPGLPFTSTWTRRGFQSRLRELLSEYRKDRGTRSRAARRSRGGVRRTEGTTLTVMSCRWCSAPRCWALRARAIFRPKRSRNMTDSPELPCPRARGWTTIRLLGNSHATREHTFPWGEPHAPHCVQQRTRSQFASAGHWRRVERRRVDGRSSRFRRCEGGRARERWKFCHGRGGDGGRRLRRE